MCGFWPMLGTTLTAGAAYRAAAARKNQAKFQAAVQQNNARLAERKAEDEIALGKRDASVQRLRGRQLAARQRAVMAAQGFDVSTGSNVDVQADTAALSAMEEERLRYNARRRAHGYRVQGTNYQNQGRLFTARAKAQTPLLDAGLAGMQYASQWYARRT